ncbi:expressed protein [Dictyostelium purpureum]|uniref:Expressed protein n=1 Tax=Dictyostelium purpureum TaxID=5786 RepID=F0ZG69_DICPU|nr:uncharacterized protein DICPUDRAFT_91703 [Dictyostelium purpureum]EGC37052.1 expressed protein [Dictyostelium purpureum]|eukprot:XP_003286409.1 expressed protein [Dictyostelium purpureum]
MKSLNTLEIANPSLNLLNDLKLLFKMTSLKKIILNVPYEEFKYFNESYFNIVQLFKQESKIELEFNIKQYNYENNNYGNQLSSSTDSISSIGSNNSNNGNNKLYLKSLNLNSISTDYVIFLNNVFLRNDEISDCRHFILTMDSGDQTYLESVMQSPKFINCERTIFNQIKSIKLILTLQDCSEFNSILGLFSSIANQNLEFLFFYIDLYYVSHNPLHNIQKIFETISNEKKFSNVKSLYIEFGRILFADYENINFYSFSPDISLDYKKFIRIKEYNSSDQISNSIQTPSACNVDHGNLGISLKRRKYLNI